MAEDKSAKPKYKQFPRIKGGPNTGVGQRRIDISAIREMYLSQGEFTWRDFCRSKGYNPESATNEWFKREVDWEAWKREWLRRRAIDLDEEVTPDMMSVTRLVAKERIKYVQDWTKTAQQMKSLLAYTLNQHIMDAAWDQAHTLEIQAGRAQRRCKLTVEELAHFASAGQRIQELQSRALMIVANPAKDAVKDADESDAANDIPEYEIHPMGNVLTSNERTRLLATYFDQFQEKLPSEAGTPQDQG